MNESSDDFHGRKITVVGNEFCKSCHGQNLDGGESGIACALCHIGPSGHPLGWLSPDSTNFHGNYIRAANWDLRPCQQCHGSDYSGGSSSASCLTCHPGTPENCSTCHGDSLNSAPPYDLYGNEETAVRGVGAHQTHLSEGMFSTAISCEECHTVPAGLYDDGHIGSELPAEVIWGEIASAGKTLTPVWNGSTCSDTYCHGNFQSGNSGNAPSWTQVDGTQAVCGSCHGLPPADGHSQVSDCSLCHGEIVNENFQIIDKEKHINGTIDVNAEGVHPDGWLQTGSGTFHGIAVRNSGWDLSACQICHGDDYGGGTVGVSCLTCHTQTPEGCTVCHGGTDNASGAPPEDIDGNTGTDYTGVGAHTIHLTGGDLSNGFSCRSCHVRPSTFTAVGHVDESLPADLLFSDLAVTDGASADWNGSSCTNAYCHGNFKGGNSNNAPLWTQVDGTQAVCGSCHGLPPAEGHPQLSDCSLCHGEVVDVNFQVIDKDKHINGTIDVNAEGVHPDGWLQTGSETFHGIAVRNSGWDLSACQRCHGEDYAGGTVTVSCRTCHSESPEGCTVCHGGSDNASGAPPEDIDGNTGTDYTGVGAHTVHLNGGDFSNGFSCETCHVVPSTFTAVGHVDAYLPADLLFSGSAVTGGAAPDWTGTTCTNTYCHGNFEGGNSSNAPLWAQVDGSQDACGSCHGLPPGGSHPQASNCSLCHAEVVDGNKIIINKDKHINGEPDSNSFNHDAVYFPIYTGEHQGEWQNDCSSCHVNSYDDFSCLTCHKHRREEMDDEHDDVSGYQYKSSSCYACHPDGKKPDDDE